MYTINPARNLKNIEEREYGAAAEIAFSTFTSCIGVISVVPGNKVIGVHLVLFSDKDEMVIPEDITRVIKILESQKYEKSKAMVVGQVDVWNGSAPTALQRLLDSLGLTKKHARVCDQYVDGWVTAKYSGGTVGLSFRVGSK